MWSSIEFLVRKSLLGNWYTSMLWHYTLGSCLNSCCIRNQTTWVGRMCHLGRSLHMCRFQQNSCYSMNLFDRYSTESSYHMSCTGQHTQNTSQVRCRNSSQTDRCWDMCHFVILFQCYCYNTIGRMMYWLSDTFCRVRSMRVRRWVTPESTERRLYDWHYPNY